MNAKPTLKLQKPAIDGSTTSSEHRGSTFISTSCSSNDGSFDYNSVAKVCTTKGFLFWVPIILEPNVTKSKIKNQKLICSFGDLYCKICANTKLTQARID